MRLKASIYSGQLMFISDVDEMVSRHYWTKVIRAAQKTGRYAIRLRPAYYYINLLTPEDCAVSKIYSGKIIHEQNLSADAIRCRSDEVIPKVYSAHAAFGWHFSYIGNIEFIKNKINSFSHQEYNTNEWSSEERIHAALNERKDLFGRYSRFTAHVIDSSWPLEMLRNPFWNKLTCPPDSLKTRIAEKMVRRFTFFMNGLSSRLQHSRFRN